MHSRTRDNNGADALAESGFGSLTISNGSKLDRAMTLIHVSAVQGHISAVPLFGTRVGPRYDRKFAEWKHWNAVSVPKLRCVETGLPVTIPSASSFSPTSDETYSALD